MSIQRRIYEQNLGVNEAVKVGDTVHIGHGTKGGTGVTGKVTKVSGGMVHIQNDRGDTFKGPVDRVTVKEAVRPHMRAGVDYKPSTPSDREKNIVKGEADKAAKMRSTPDTSAAGRAAQRMIDARKATQAGLKAKQQKQESVEIEEGPAHQNPLITAYGGMKGYYDSPTFKRYQERLAKEREERAKRATQQGLQMKKQKRESVELDELKMPKRDASGRIKSAKVRDALQAGGSRAQQQALKHDASAHAKLMRAADTQDQAVANMDKEGMKKADRQIDAANADMARSRRAFGRMKKRHRQAESVELDESIVGRWRRKSREGFTFKNKNEPKPTDKAPEPKSKELPKNMRSEAIKYDSAGDSTGTVTGKGKRDRGPGGTVMVKYKGSETYPKGAKLPIGARDMGRLLKQARKSGTTPYDSRNLRNPRLTKDHVELEGLDLSEMNFLGKDKKFGREFYEKDGQLHVKKPGGTYVQNLGSVSVPANKKMMKGLVKDSNESFDKLTPAQERDLDRRLKPTRSTVAKVRLPATNSEKDRYVKAWRDEMRGTTTQRRLRDLRLKREEVELDELKTSTLQSYVDKAMKDNQNRAVRLANVAPAPTPKREMGKLRNRRLGIHSAKSRLGARDVEDKTGVSYPKVSRRATGESVELGEVSPPGFEGTVKAMKKRHSDKIDNPWALAWWMKNKGYKSHKKPDGSPKEGE